jgi:hypothetical protein
MHTEPLVLHNAVGGCRTSGSVFHTLPNSVQQIHFRQSPTALYCKKPEAAGTVLGS